MIWSSCFEPVPPILNLPGPAALAASIYSLAVLYGLSALSHKTNWSRANIATGVMSCQLNGTPVANGVVNKFERVITILFGSPLASLIAKNPSAPAPAPLFTGMTACFIKLFLVIMPWIMRAIWSAPPPGPAGMMNSTGFVGSQAANAGEAPVTPRANAVEINASFNFIFMNAPPKKI